MHTLPLRSGTSFSVKLGFGGKEVVHKVESEGAMSLPMGSIVGASSLASGSGMDQFRSDIRDAGYRLQDAERVNSVRHVWHVFRLQAGGCLVLCSGATGRCNGLRDVGLCTTWVPGFDTS